MITRLKEAGSRKGVFSMENKKKMTRSLYFITKCISLLFVASLLSNCASSSTVEVSLGEAYRDMTSAQSADERVIDRLTWTGPEHFCASENCSIPPTRVQPVQRATVHPVLDLGGFFRTGMLSRPGDAPSRHFAQPMLETFRFEAARRFPNDPIAIRSATWERRHHTVMGTAPDGRSRWHCQVVHTALIVATDPMPQPVTHSDTITVTPAGGGSIIGSDGSVIGHIAMTQVTRADLFRRAHNWITNEQRNAQIEFADLDLGRIIGYYSFTISGGQTYRITSNFIIDVHDAAAQIRFEDTILQRGGTGTAEPIFLQSIANTTYTRLINFTDALISRMTSPGW